MDLILRLVICTCEEFPVKPVITAAIALSFDLAHGATEQGFPVEPCEEIRARINEHKGIPAKPNTELLGRIGANNQCRFTSAEVYRAVWGDKPVPSPRTHERRHRRHDEDD